MDNQKDRPALYWAAINCAHSITDDVIILRRNPGVEGNALAQLGDRLAAAASPTAAAQPLWDENGEPWNEAAEKVEQARLATAAQPGETWAPAEQAAFSAWAITEFPNESSQGLISLGSAWKQGQNFAHLASQSQAVQPSIDSLVDSYLTHGVLGDMPNHRAKLIQLAKGAASLAGQSQATRAVPVRGAFLNTQGGVTLCQNGKERESCGFAGYLYAAPTAQEVTQQAAPDAPTALADLPISMAERVSILMWMAEYRKHKFLALSDQALVCKLEAPAAQQAAKAETAEQAPSAKVIINDGNGTATIMLAPGADLKVGTSLYLTPTTSTVSADKGASHE